MKSNCETCGRTFKARLNIATNVKTGHKSIVHLELFPTLALLVRLREWQNKVPHPHQLNTNAEVDRLHVKAVGGEQCEHLYFRNNFPKKPTEMDGEEANILSHPVYMFVFVLLFWLFLMLLLLLLLMLLPHNPRVALITAQCSVKTKHLHRVPWNLLIPRPGFNPENALSLCVIDLFVYLVIIITVCPVYGPADPCL